MRNAAPQPAGPIWPGTFSRCTGSMQPGAAASKRDTVANLNLAETAVSNRCCHLPVPVIQPKRFIAQEFVNQISAAFIALGGDAL